MLRLRAELVHPLVGQEPAQELGDLVEGGHREDVRRRALQHGDVRGVAGHRRDQGDRGGATADDDDLLAGVVQVLRPVLWVDALTLELVHAREGRQVARVVVVVAGAADQEAAGVACASRRSPRAGP